MTGLIIAVAGCLLPFWMGVESTYLIPKWVIITLGCLIAWGTICRRARKGTIIIPRTPFDLPILAMLLVILASTVVSSYWQTAVWGEYFCPSGGAVQVLLYFLLFYAAIVLGRDEPELVFGTILHCSLIMVIYGAFQAQGIGDLVPYRLPEGRITATMGSPVFLGTVLAMAFPIGLRWATEMRFPAERRQLFGAALMGILSYGLVLTYSRGAWLAAMVGSLAYLWASRKIRVTFFGVYVFLGLAAAGLMLSWPWLQRVQSDMARLEVWRIAYKVFQDSPLLGSGPDTFLASFKMFRTVKFLNILGFNNVHLNAHNDIIQMAATMGLAGLSVYAWLHVVLVKFISEVREDAGWVIGDYATTLGSLAAVMTVAKFNPIPFPALALISIVMGAGFSPMIYSWAKKNYSRKVDLDMPGISKWDAKKAATIGAALSLILAGYALRHGMASRQINLAQIAGSEGRLWEIDKHMRTATQLNPYRLEHVEKHAKMLDRLTNVASRNDRIGLAWYSARLGRQAMESHPAYTTGFYIYGCALVKIYALGGPDLRPEAALMLGIAQDLDPIFVPLLRLRIALDREMRSGGKR